MRESAQTMPITWAIYERPDVKARLRGLPERTSKPPREPRFHGFQVHTQIDLETQRKLGFKVTTRRPKQRRKAA